MLEVCHATQKTIQMLVDLKPHEPDHDSIDSSVYTNDDGMYDYQQYKKHAKNRKTGSVDDGLD